VARAQHVKLSPCEKRVLLALADELDDTLGGNDVRDFATKIMDRGGWATTEQFLNAAKRDVWWHYSQAGDPDDKPIYEAAEASVYEAIRGVQRCKRGP